MTAAKIGADGAVFSKAGMPSRKAGLWLCAFAPLRENVLWLTQRRKGAKRKRAGGRGEDEGGRMKAEGGGQSRVQGGVKIAGLFVRKQRYGPRGRPTGFILNP